MSENEDGFASILYDLLEWKGHGWTHVDARYLLQSAELHCEILRNLIERKKTPEHAKAFATRSKAMIRRIKSFNDAKPLRKHVGRDGSETITGRGGTILITHGENVVGISGGSSWPTPDGALAAGELHDYLAGWIDECGQDWRDIEPAGATATVLDTPESIAGNDVPLGPKQQDILQALFELDAFDSDSRLDAKQVAKRAGGHSANPESYKKPLAKLTGLGLCESKRGAGGGTWLTPSGRVRAERISKAM